MPYKFFWIFVKSGFFSSSVGFSWSKKPIFHLVWVSRESGILGLKNENPCFENFLWGPRLMVPSRGRWRVTRIFGGEKFKIWKWFFDHVFSRSQAFQNYLHFYNRMSRNQDIPFLRYWVGSWKVTVGLSKNIKKGLFSSLILAS